MKKKSMLIVAILLMSIGFAAISTTLIINGSTKVSENHEDFSVIFTAASIDGKDVYSTAVDETKKIITFTTSELKTLNQTSILTYEVTNNSSNYDAEVIVTCVPKTGTTAKYTSIKNKLENDATVVKAKSSVNGTLTVTLDKVATETVTEEYTCKLEFNAVERDTLGKEISAFASDSWSKIAANVRNGNTSKYNVGDTKEVDLGELGTHTVRISNMSACTTETSESACGFVVEFADIITEQQFNSIGTIIGGWKDSELRTYINDTLYNVLPGDLKSVIATTKVISGHISSSSESNFETQDKLYLLSPAEIFGNFAELDEDGQDTAHGTSKQLDYYKKMGTTTEKNSASIKEYNKTANAWWLRLPVETTTTDVIHGTTTKTNIIFAVGTDFFISPGIPNLPSGVSPAFRIA